MAIVFAVLLHTTRFGRMIYAVGSNRTACDIPASARSASSSS
jgi:ribose/xylose/arabinose/galactoside ABC-type transport system permease subunit